MDDFNFAKDSIYAKTNIWWRLTKAGHHKPPPVIERGTAIQANSFNLRLGSQ